MKIVYLSVAAIILSCCAQTSSCNLNGQGLHLPPVADAGAPQVVPK